MSSRNLAPVALLVALALSLAGCGPTRLESRWSAGEVVIDGDDAEWREYEHFHDERTATHISMMNDETHLYICVTTWNRPLQRRVLTSGLTFWFDTGDGSSRVWGIEFPVAKSPDLVQELRESVSWEPEGRRGGEELIERLIDESGAELMLGKSASAPGEWMTAGEAAGYGVEAALGWRNRILICELKVPLDGGAGASFRLPVSERGTIGVGLETGDYELVRPEGEARFPAGIEREGRPGGRPGGGMPGGGHPDRSMPGGGRQGGSRPTEIKAFFRVILAQKH